MRPVLPFVLACLALPAASAPPQEWRSAPEYDVLLTSYDIEPATIHLKAGQPVRLRFVNNSNQGHSFAARDFFRQAKLRRRDAPRVADGELEVPPLSTETIALVPKAGRYKVGGGSFLRRLLGMNARIVVE
jgi:plastocyanin